MTTALMKHSKPALTVEEVMAKIPEGPWFMFDQNNSGGYWTFPAKNVLMVAETEEAAWERLRDLPDYTSESCDCCGARWGYAEKMTKAEAVARIIQINDPDSYENRHISGIPTLLILPEYLPNKANKPIEILPGGDT
jgi:hypothetical protein